MVVANLEISQELNQKIGLKDNQNINIIKLFEMFGIDINYVISEKSYQKDFLNDIKNNNVIISNTF